MIDIKSINEVLKLFATETGAFVTTGTGLYIDLTIPGEENIVLSVPVTHECEHVMELMNADHIKLSFSSTVGVTIPIGSYVVWNGITYRLTKPYTPTRKNEIEYRYEPEFQSKVMGWAIKPFFFLTKSGTTVISRETDWQLTGTPTDFLNAVKDSILDETGETYTFSIASGLIGSKTLSFESSDILSALNSIAETFETEWWVVGTVIYLGDCSIGTAVSLTAGIHVSVPEVTKSDKGYFTRFYAFGSSRNIVQDYVAGTTTNYVVEKRLSLPAATCPNGYKDIREGLTMPEIATKVLTFDHIYPRSNLSISDLRVEEKFRVDAAGNKIILSTDPETGAITYETYNIYFFKIPDFLFDPDTIIEGKTLSVHFNSGYLLDQEFELAYHEDQANLGHGEFEIILDESTGVIVPNSILAPVVGDEVVIFNITLPQEYISSAESELESALDAEMAEYLDDNDTYKVNSFPVKFHNDGITLGIGSNVNFINASTSLSSRVIAITEKLDFPAQKVITIGKSKRTGTISQLKEAVKKVKSDTISLEGAQKQATSNTRRMFRDAKETIELLNKALLNYTGSINPITVQTMSLLVGDESLQFRFVDSKTTPVTVGYTIAYDPETKILSAPVGIIQHMTLDINSISSAHAVNEYKFWDIPLFESAELTDPAKKYYLYARVSSSDQTGVLLLSETAIALNSEAGYYHLLVGILNSEYEKDRSFVTLYGFTEVLPGRITTDKIISSSGNTYIDLLLDKIKMGGFDHNVTEANTTILQNVKIKGSLIVGPDGGSFPLGRPRGAYVPGTPYYKGDEVTYNGSTWMYINDVPSDEAVAPAPVEGAYWLVTAAKGDTGLPGADGGDGSAGADSRYCTLIAAAMAVSFDTAGNTPSPTSILLTATAYNLVGTPYYQFFENDSSLGSPSTTNTKWISMTGRVYADMPRKIEVQVREGSSVGTIIARDQISIIGMKAGENAVQGIIENSSHTVPASSAGVVSSYSGSGTKIQVYEGATLLQFNTTLASGRFIIGTPVVSPAGKITVGARSGSGTTTCTVADHSEMDAATDVVTITYPITARKADGTDVTFNLVQTITKSKQGSTGDPGTPAPYYEYRYAVNGSTVVYPAITVTDRNPANYSMTKPAVETMQTLWFTVAKVSADGSTLLENWTTPDKMAANNNGSYNPTPVDRETYAPASSYHGGTDYIDIVYYSGRFYYARIDAGDIPVGTAPTNTAYWNPFEAKVPNIATGLLLADLAYIRNLGVRYVKTAESGKRIFVDGDNNTMTLYDSDGNETTRIDDDIDSDQAGTPLGGLKARNPTTGKVTYVTANGVFNNGAGVSFLPGSSGLTTNANLVGLLQARNSDSNGYSSAIVGVDQTTSGNSKSYAGFFIGKVRGSTVVESFMKMPADRGIYDLPDSNVTLYSTYSSDKKYFFWGGKKTADRVYNLPDPADYENGEIIWFANGNDHNSELKARYGDTINDYAYDARWVTLNGPTDFVEFMSNGSNMWKIVRSGGDNVVF